VTAADLRRKVTRQLISRLIEHEHGFKRKGIRIGIGLAVLYLIYLFCAGDYGLLRIRRLHDQRDELQAEYRNIVAEAVDYSYSLRRIDEDQHYVEWLARTKYGFSRPGEIIYRLKTPTR